jgi:tRNA-dihydrouridine synthase B
MPTAPARAGAVGRGRGDGRAAGAQGRALGRLAEIARRSVRAASVRRPRGAAFVDLVADHYEAMLRFYGRDLGLRVARKHLGWYMDTAPAPPQRCAGRC